MNQVQQFETDDLAVRYHGRISGDPRAIDPAVREILANVRAAGCADGVEDDLALAVHEALANAVRHGSKNDPAKLIECLVACDPACGILVIVRDEGPGFDPDAVPSPVHGERLFESHGRGIFLINQLMDKVEFARGGTEIRMVKRPRNGSR